MKKLIADLLLIAGVVTASLAAGESRRVSKTVALEGDLSAEVLHQAVASAPLEEHPDNYVFVNRTLDAGEALTAESVAWLRSLDRDTVSVLRQAKSSEELPVDDEGAIGRVLSEALLLDAEMEETPAGRIIDAAFVERLEATDLATVRVEYQPVAVEGESAGDSQETDWVLERESEESDGTDSAPAEPATDLETGEDSEANNPEGVELIGCKLAETVLVPRRLKPSTFLDAPTLELIAASGHETVSVKIPTKFSWQSWGQRWTFIVGVLLTLFGVLLKRSKVSGEELETDAVNVASLASELVALENQVAELVPRSELLDADALHEAVDPLLTGPVYRFGLGRESIRTAHGGSTYNAVMDAFSRGERKLNRCWSAAVDGYAEEARVSLAAALMPLREAREALPGTYQAAKTGSSTPAPRGSLGNESGELRMPPDVPHRDPEDQGTQL